jgi:diguanylate cyclase (GGDEF)-like protein
VIIYVLTHIIVFTGIGISLYQNWGLRLEDAKSRLLRSAEMGNMLVENTLVDAAKSLDIAKQEIENTLRSNTLTPQNTYRILSTSLRNSNTYSRSDYLGLLFLIDANGQLIGRSDEYTSKLIDFSDRFYYQDLRDHPEKKYTVGPLLIARTTGEWVFHMAVPIRDQSGKLAGILIRQLLQKDISNELRKYTETSDFIQMMTHANKNPVSFAYPPPNKAATSAQELYPQIVFNFDLLENPKGTGFWSSTPAKKNDVMVGYSRSFAFGLTTFVTMPMQKIQYRFLKSNLYFFMYILVGVIFITFIFFYLYKISIALSVAQSKASHDALTGLHNRRALYENMPLLLRESMRAQRPVSVFFIDIDFFRLFNERSGHEAGDLALQLVAQALASCCRRPQDFICRWGGEEFVAVLPHTDNTAALKIAHDMLDSVRKIQLSGVQQNNPHITVSVGFITHLMNPNNIETDLVDLADQAVRHAKHLGRNQCVQFNANWKNPNPTCDTPNNNLVSI